MSSFSETYLAEAQLLTRTGSFAWAMSSGNLVWSEETYRILGVDRSIEPTIDVEEHHTHDRAPHDRARNDRGFARGTRVAPPSPPHGLSSGRAKEARSCASSFL